jgi:hypothetical protein
MVTNIKLLVLLILVTITVFNGMRQEVITCFVDIGDHHCIQWYETRGDCLMVTNINKTSNHLLSHTIEYSDGHQYQQNK